MTAAGMTGHSASLRERARAKVNLTLQVRGRRPDGYHDLASLVAFADIGDLVTFTPGPAPSGVQAFGPFASAISGENLADVALRRLADVQPDLVLGAVSIKKVLPVAGGLGGGSADAAAVLRAVRRANAGREADIDWFAIAAEIGADVPGCLMSQTVQVSGVGERLRPVAGLPPLPAVLVNPGGPVPADKTRQVFWRLSAPPLRDAVRDPDLPSFTGSRDVAAYLRDRGNDLEAPAQVLMPQVKDALAALLASGDCLLARMSGAGPTAFGLYPTAALAKDQARRLAAAHPQWWVRSTILG